MFVLSKATWKDQSLLGEAQMGGGGGRGTDEVSWGHFSAIWGCEVLGWLTISAIKWNSLSKEILWIL